MAAAVMSGTVNYFAGRDESLHNFAEMDASTASEKEHFDLHYIQSVVSDGSTSDTRIVEVVELNNCNSSGDGVREQMDQPVRPKSEGHSKVPPKAIGLCKVCGDEASGMYFGALVCVPCKTFFLRYAGDNSFVCKRAKNCEITVYSRTHCKFCRMMKCLDVGMCRKERPDQVQITEGQQLCIVCQDLANGIHFGAITCEGCKKFFRRGLTEHQSYTCKNDKKCVINPRTRNACRFCRFQKCLRAGMSREAIQMGRPSKVRYNHDTSCHNEIEKKRIHLDSSGDSGNSSTHSSPILRIPDHFQPCNDFRSLLQYDMNLSGGNNFAGLATKANGEIIFGSLDFLQPPFPQIAVSSCSLPIYQPHINISATSYHLGDSKQPHALHQTQLLHQPLQHSTVLHPQQRLNIPSSDLWSPQSNKFDVKSVRDCINYIPELGLTEEPPLELTRVMPVEMPVSREVLNIGDGERSLAILSTLNSLQLPEITIASSSHWHTNSTIDNDLRSILKAEKEKALQLCGSELNIHHGLLSDWHVESEGNLSPKLESGIGLSEIMGERDSESDKSVLTSFAGSVLQVKIDSLEAPPASNDAATIVQFKDNYWTDTTLPIEDIFLSEEHMKIVQDILAAYNRFVDTGSNINQQLRREFDNLRAQGIPESETVEKLHARIHFLYTVSSVTYCQSLPGFRAFNRADQYRLIRLGQSQSRMLVAACHWYQPESDDFKDFMFWRDNTYPVKMHLLEFSRDFHKLHLDRVEAALLNTLIITATDYPGLENPTLIEDHRVTVMRAFRAYTTAVYGSRNKRLETLFHYIPRMRELGNEHHKSTFDISLSSTLPSNSSLSLMQQAPLDSISS